MSTRASTGLGLGLGLSLSGVMGGGRAALEPISGGAQWPYLTKTVTGPVQFQQVLIAREPATKLRLLYLNNTGAEISFIANVRKGFSGVISDVTVGGISTITIPAYSSVTTDPLDVSTIAAGEMLYCRSFFGAVGDIAYSAGLVSYVNYNPEGAVIPSPVSGYQGVVGWLPATTNRMTETGGTWEREIDMYAHEQACFGPYAILGQREADAKPMLTVVGDSKTAWLRPPGSHPGGLIEKAFGVLTGRAYQNLSIPGDVIAGLLDTSPQGLLRQSLLTYTRALLYRYGTNSVSNGSDPEAATEAELANMQSLIALVPAGCPVYVATIDPNTRKDAEADWGTVTEEQQSQGGNGNLGVDCPSYFNNHIKTSTPGYINEAVNTASVVATASGYWLPEMTVDGIHQTDLANTAQASVIAAALS